MYVCVFALCRPDPELINDSRKVHRDFVCWPSQFALCVNRFIVFVRGQGFDGSSDDCFGYFEEIDKEGMSRWLLAFSILYLYIFEIGCEDDFKCVH